MKRPAQLTVTHLEDRTVPAVFGNTWVDTNLTVSLVPDGTDVAGAPSALFRTLGARATADEWQGAIRAAFRTWAAPTNLSFSAVSDDGRAIGTPGPVQGSPFVGDIRISARPLSDNVLAIANPFDLVSAWAGEIVVNSNKVFDTDGSAGANDLQAVLLHEIGHVLGIAGSTDPASVMYEAYTGPRTALSAGDVASIQGLYGARTVGPIGRSTVAGTDGTASTAGDWAAGKGTNETTATATNLGQSRDSTDRRWDFVGDGRLDTAADRDVYQVRTREKAGDVLVVYVGTPAGGGLPAVTVYDKKGSAVPAETLLANDGSLIVQVADVKKNQTYYVSVQAADPAKWTRPEGYEFGIDFRTGAVVPDNLASKTLTAAQSQVARGLEVTQSQGFRFQLSAVSTTDTAPTAARFTVFDSTGTAVFTLVAKNGQTVIGDVLLAPGTYTVVTAGATADGSPLNALQIRVSVIALTDPIGPALADDYSAPAAPAPAAPAPSPMVVRVGFFWLAPASTGAGFLAPTSPYSSPWW